MGADAYITEAIEHGYSAPHHPQPPLRATYAPQQVYGQGKPGGQGGSRICQSPDDQLMERVMEVINENISDSDLSVDIIAQKVGISRVHLHRKMKELTNQTPHSFIRNIRLKQAAKLLKDDKHNVTEVMYACGFSIAASFSTMFKNLYGCSPGDYMNQAFKGEENVTNKDLCAT